MENLETLLPDTDKIKRWKVRITNSKVKVYLRLKDISRDYEPEELKKSLIGAKIPIDNIFSVGGYFKSFCGDLDKLGFYRLWIEGDRLGLKVFKNIVPEEDKFGRIPELLKVVRDYVALGEEK